MPTLQTNQPLPVCALAPPVAGPGSLQLMRTEGTLAYRAQDVLLPHRQHNYVLVFARRGNSRHWVDMIPYVVQDNTFYFTVPGQLLVKEDPQPAWNTSLVFTSEFLALQNSSLAQLPLLQNPQHGHELRLAAADAAFVEDILARLEAEYCRPAGEWQQRMLVAYLEVLLIHLSRLYTQQFATTGAPDKLLLQRYRAQIEAGFRERHEVSAYAAQLHITARHLSEVVKAQSGKPAIAHI
ncbi:MAG: hypothetical protein ACRYFX_30820 [Janthinobacterium lividum]